MASTRRPLSERLARALAFLAGAYFALWACAPPATLPPPVAPGGYERQMGAALTGTSVVSPGSCTAGYFAPYNCGVDAQLWANWELGRRIALGGSLAGGFTTIAGATVDLRLRLKETDTLRAGLSLRAGSALTLGGYVAGALSDRAWIYVHPNVGYSFYGPIEVPVGLSVDLNDRWALVAEAGAGFDPTGAFSWETDSSLNYAPRTTIGWLTLGINRGF